MSSSRPAIDLCDMCPPASGCTDQPTCMFDQELVYVCEGFGPRPCFPAPGSSSSEAGSSSSDEGSSSSSDMGSSSSDMDGGVPGMGCMTCSVPGESVYCNIPNAYPMCLEGTDVCIDATDMSIVGTPLCGAPGDPCVRCGETNGPFCPGGPGGTGGGGEPGGNPVPMRSHCVEGDGGLVWSCEMTMTICGGGMTIP